MNIAITGAAGFIGSNLVSELNKLNHNDLILVDYYDMFAKTWNYSLKNANYLRIIEPDDFLKYYKDLNVGIVYHIGGTSTTTISDSTVYFKNNYDYTINLINLFSKYSLRKFNDYAYFVNASSSAVYGNGKGPLNAYAMSKKMVDDYITTNFNKLNNQIVSFRFFNVFGPNEYHKDKMASMIYQLYNEYWDKYQFTIFEFGEQSRDHIYVKDLVSNIIDYTDNKYSVNPVLDLGTGKSTTFNQLLNYIKMSIPDCETLYAPIVFKPMTDKIKKVYQVFTQAKFPKEWHPVLNYTLESGIKDYYHEIEGYKNWQINI